MLNTTQLLLVDDDEFVRGALTRALNQTGAFSVIGASSGQEALALVASRQVDAILTDLQMPTMDGLTLLGQLFERGIRLPVAVMTGQAIAPDLSRRLHEYGIAAVFSKPVDVGTLADELQRSLDPETVGRIRGITLFGLLQLLEVERKTALIVVRIPAHEGRLYFAEGTLAHAHVGRLMGVEAVHEILAWPDPSAEIFYKRRARQRTVDVPLQHLLMESARLLDERADGHTSAHGTTKAPPTHAPGPSNARPRSDGPTQAVLDQLLTIAGAVGAVLVDAQAGMALGSATASGEFAPDLAAALATDIVRAQTTAARTLRPADVVEDMMITLGRQYHLICFPDGTQDIFVYLVLNREQANLGMARHQLRDTVRRISV